MALGSRFKKLRGGATGGAEFSEGQGKLDSLRRLDCQGRPCFSANVLFLWQYCYKLFLSLYIF